MSDSPLHGKNQAYEKNPRWQVDKEVYRECKVYVDNNIYSCVPIRVEKKTDFYLKNPDFFLFKSDLFDFF